MNHSVLKTLHNSKELFTSIQLQRAFVTNAVTYEKFKIRSNEDFEARVKKSKVPVIVDFFATWCNPCRTLTPRLETIIAENEGKVALAVVDIDENTDLALDYEVGAVPVLLAVRNGKVKHRLVGLRDTVKLREWVDNILAETVAVAEPVKIKLQGKVTDSQKKL